MRYWLTGGVFHREGTMVKDFNGKYQQGKLLYPDEGTPFEISIDMDTITIPNGTTRVGVEAFFAMYNPRGLLTQEEKEYQVFLQQKLKKIILPSGLKEIERNAFAYCKALEEIELPDGLESVGTFAFTGTALNKVIVPESVRRLQAGSFMDCQNLEEVRLPASETDIDSSAFIGCSSLISITIPPYISHMLVLHRCRSLREIHIQAPISQIPDYCFSGCASLEEFNVPDTVTEIAGEAFRDCTSLRKLVIPAKTKTVNSRKPFFGCNALEHIVLKSAIKGFETVFDDIKSVVKRVEIKESGAGLAHAVFPNAEVFDLKGHLLFNPGQIEKAPADTVGSVSFALIGEKKHPGTIIPRFEKAECNIKAGSRSFRFVFKSAMSANKIIKSLINGDEDSESVYDPDELIRANGYHMYIFEHHSGEYIPALEEGVEAYGYERVYSKPLSKVEIQNRVNDFFTTLRQCFDVNQIRNLLDTLPHKKSGALYNGRVTTIIKLRCADSEGYIPVLVAKNVSDTEVEISLKQRYIGSEEYNDSDIALIVNSASDPRSETQKKYDMLLAQHRCTIEKIMEIRKQPAILEGQTFGCSWNPVYTPQLKRTIRKYGWRFATVNNGMDAYIDSCNAFIIADEQQAISVWEKDKGNYVQTYLQNSVDQSNALLNYLKAGKKMTVWTEAELYSWISEHPSLLAEAASHKLSTFGAGTISKAFEMPNGNYSVKIDGDNACFINHESGGTYQTSLTECTCPA